MKKLLLLSFFILSFSASKAQWVNIPSAYFVAWLQANYPSCMNGNLMDTTCSGVVNTTWVICSGQNISNLEGIQYFNSLIGLDCSDNNLSYLPTLPNSLTFLSCSYNSITSLPTLPTSLIEFDCDYNSLTSLPALPNSLTMLGCYTNSLTSLPTLPSSLTHLDCSNNSLTNLPFLPNSLTYLGCSNNSLTSLPLLPNSLTDLYCNNNSLTSLPPLPNLISDLYCSWNSLTSLPSLPNSLTRLDCSYNLLTSLPTLHPLMYCFIINYNTGIFCMPILQNFGGSAALFNILNTGIACLPNVIQHTGYIGQIDGWPICDLTFNPNNCDLGWNIIGKVAFDVDSSCATTTDGIEMPMIKMKLFDGGGNLLQQMIANWEGYYSFDTQIGNYSTSVDTSNIPFSVLCPSNNSIISNLTAIDSMDYNVDFRMVCKPGFDICVWNIYRNAPNFFPGNTTPVRIVAGDFASSISNGFCGSTISGEVKVIINGSATYLSPIAGSLTPIVNGDTLIYTIADFSLVNETSDFAFNVITDTTAQIGNQICFDVTVTPSAGDNNISNNTLTHCFAVSNSFDPNEKEVSPIGSLTYPYNDWLTYTIHFQNTGTAAAQHIQLLDTLDADLDASTFQLLSYSHTPMVQIIGSEVAFNFVNINLPDSTTDLAGSQGYVSYRVMPMTNLPMGTVIENTASIYFDFNAPVVTNTVSNLICNPIIPTNISEAICSGDSYNLNGTNIFIAGNYSTTLNAINGCDSVVNLSLTILNPVSNSISASICSGITFDFNGQQLSVAGNYADTLTAATGCDSIVNLSLTVLNPITSSTNQTICFGDSINFNGVYFDTTGIYTDTLSNASGCDSIVNLSLTVLSLATSSFNQTICIGETFLFNGINETATGIYYDTLNAASNCDSIIALHLTVNNPNATISLTGNTLTATGTGIIQWINCDSGTFVPGVIGGTFTPTTIGNYAAWVWDGLCSDTTNCVEVLLDGINELTIYNLQFTIFPNPVDENITVQLSQSCNNCRIEISNTLGQILYTEIINDKVEIINLVELPAGIYFVAVRSDKFYSIKKLVKQ